MSIRAVDDRVANEFSVELEQEQPQGVLAWAVERFSPALAISTALQIDGAVLIDMAYAIDPEIRVFTVDTGRLPKETDEFIEQLRARYPQLNLERVRPEARDVEEIVARKGPNLFYESVENRLLCCHVRKVTPLQRHLQGLEA